MLSLLSDTVLATSAVLVETVLAKSVALLLTTDATSFVLSETTVILSDRSLRKSRPGFGANSRAAAAPIKPPINKPFAKPEVPAIF
ncbi:hypothetical protein D1872_299660 [compost metagenome]